MNNVEVSIITCHDGKEDISTTLKSIQSQDYEGLELIVVQPKFVSGTEGLLQELNISSRTRLINDENRGVYSAMNLGAEFATGHYLLFLNSGDEFFDSHSLSKLMLCKNEGGWAYGTLKVSDIDGITCIYEFNPYSRLLHRIGWKYVPHPASIISKELFIRLGKFDEILSISADQKIFLKASTLVPPMITDEIITHFKRGGRSERSLRASIQDSRRISNELFGPLIDCQVIDDLFWWMNYGFKKIAKNYLKFHSKFRRTRADNMTHINANSKGFRE